MMSSRIRQGERHFFDCFLEVVRPVEGNGNHSSSNNGPTKLDPWILQTYPPTYKDKEADKLKAVPPFVFPCKLEVTTVQNYSFVLTNVDAQWTFGFCRQAPNSQTALVILSSLPWHETFYRLLNHAAELTSSTDDSELWRFLESAYSSRVADNPGSLLHVSWDSGNNKRDFTCQTPPEGRLPTIPENRNLTEYYNAVGIHNMLVIFASMLYERRIVITSRRLSRLSACVQAANSIIYPMHWQHIFIPILPKHLIEYLSAPMPFLIGVPSPIMARVKTHELGDAVILDADTNVIQSPFADDLESIPADVASALKRSLKNHKDLLGDSVARAFLQALVHLIGGYRDALKFRQGEKISFDEESFLCSRPASLRPFLEQMLQLQIFRQFVEERLQMLNTGKGFSDEFEMEAVRFQERMNSGGIGGNNGKLKMQYAQISSSVRKEGGAIVKAVKNKMSPMLKSKKSKDPTNPAVKSAVKSVKESSKGLQHKGKSAYREMRSKMKTTNSSSQLEEYDHHHHTNNHTRSAGRLGSSASSSSAPSSPVLALRLSVSSGSSGGSAASVSNSSQVPAKPPGKTMTMPGLSRNNPDFSIGNRVLKYERFDPPTLPGVPHNPFGNHHHLSSSDSKLSPDMEEMPQKIDLDLMSDLQDVIFKRSSAEHVATKVPPVINRHEYSPFSRTSHAYYLQLKPSLRRSDAHNTLSNSFSQPNLLPVSSYENLYSNGGYSNNNNNIDLEVEVATDDEEDKATILPLPPDQSPVVRVAAVVKQPGVSLQQQQQQQPKRPQRRSNEVQQQQQLLQQQQQQQHLTPVAPPRPRKTSSASSSSSSGQSDPSARKDPRKPSLSEDLIKLDCGQSIGGGNNQDIIFDPLLESSSVSKKSLPHPPSTSTLPQIAQLYDQHRPLHRAMGSSSNNNNNNPFSPPPTADSGCNSSNSNPFMLRDNSDRQKTRNLLTKSSDDLLKDYGIDFGKLSAVSNEPYNSLSVIGMQNGGNSDPFADLDPLRRAMPNTRSVSTAVPSAPPRAKKQQQNWTTFE